MNLLIFSIFILFLQINISKSDSILQQFSNSTSDNGEIVHVYNSNDRIIQMSLETNISLSAEDEIVMVVRFDHIIDLWRVAHQNSAVTQQETAKNHTKNLCLSKSDSSKNITITVLKNKKIIPYTLTISEHMQVSLTRPNKTLAGIYVSHSKPALVRIELDPAATEGKRFQLEVRNQSLAACALVSVISTDEICPDKLGIGGSTVVGTVNYALRQSMLEQASILLPQNFNNDSLYVIVALKTTQEGCTFNKTEIIENSGVDHLVVSMELKEQSESVWVSVVAVLGIYLAIIAFLSFIYNCLARDLKFEGVYGTYDRKVNHIKDRSVFQKLRRFTRKARSPVLAKETNPCEQRAYQQTLNNKTENLDPTETLVNFTVSLALDTVDSPTTDAVDDPQSHSPDIAPLEDIVVASSTTPRKKPSKKRNFPWQKRLKYFQPDEESVDGRDEDVVPTEQANKEDLRKRRMTENNVASVAADYAKSVKERTKADRHERDNSYLWLTGLMGLFYLLPVLQLVLNHQQVYLDSGNQDVCYFNFRCKYQFWIFEDFGHVFSNLSYIMCGFLFIFLVYRRKIKYEEQCSTWEDRYHPENCGIPEQYGIYYALGLALIMEGFLSACYHICPTTKNFQFDTTFMYTIGILVFLKVYQFRHPDITHKARSIFLILGITLTIEVIGYYTTDMFFWVIFVLLELIIVTCLIIQPYYSRYLSNICPGIKLDWDSIRNFSCFTPCKDIKFENEVRRSCVRSIVAFLFNVGLCVVILWLRKPGVSRYILMLILANMMMYVAYYVYMKCYYRCRCTDFLPNEGLRKTSLIYALISGAFAVIALYYFTTERKKSSYSPAESRNINFECEVGIFDTHDMWHFCSSFGLLFMFMFILTLEDNNVAEKRKNMPVF